MRIKEEFAQRIIEAAIKAGADKAEVYIVRARSVSVEVKDGEVDSLDTSSDFGYALRVLKDERPGFSYSTTGDDWQTVVDSALDVARFTERDPSIDIAEPQEDEDIQTHDPEIASADETRVVECARMIEEEAYRTDPRVKKIRKAEAGFSESEVLISNTKGLTKSYKATSVIGQIMLAAEQADEAQMGWGYESSRFLKNIDFRRVGQDAAMRAVRLLGARRASTTKGFVLVEASVAAELLGILSSSFSSENVQKGKSMLMNKKDEQVFSELVCIVDNPLLSEYVGSRPFDAEGVTSRRNIVVDRGVLKGYLYNIYTARRENLHSTGNAIRGGIQSPPSVGISNFYIEPASPESVRSYAELVKGIDKGMIVTEAMGMHTANPITGEFSVGVTGLWVKNGKIDHPVKEAAISGNLIDLFNKVVAFSDNTRFYGRVGSPDILIEGINISG